MFKDNEGNDNLNEFLNDDNYNSSDTEKILNAVSKVEVGIISAVASFFENISFIEETQSIEDNININSLNILKEIQSLRDILMNLPSLKNSNLNIETNHNQKEIIEKLNDIIENLKSDLDKTQLENINPQINLNINEALIPLNQKLESLNTFINEINSQIQTLKVQNLENNLNEENIKEIFNTIETNKHNDNIIDSLSCLNEKLNQNLKGFKEFFENNNKQGMCD